MDTYCTFVQTHRMYTTRSVPCCKLWALDGVMCQCRFTILTTWWGCWHRGNYVCVGPGGTWGISLLPLRFVTSLVAQMVKNLPAMGRPGFDPWVGKIPWRGKWQPTPLFLPGESHGQRSLAGYSPWNQLQRVTYNWATNPFTFFFPNYIRKIES